MRLRPHRRGLVVFSSSVAPAESDGSSRKKRTSRAGSLPRFVRIGALLTVIAVRPRWKPLLAGTAMMVFGLVAREGTGGIFVIPGLVLLWQAVLIPGDTDADRDRRSRLKRELAAYSTAAQRCDLEATLDRYPDGATYEIRDILTGQAVAASNQAPGAGPR